MRRFFAITVFLLISASSALASETRFPDLASDAYYREAVEMLNDIGVIRGNPDGTLAPDREVNRAEILTMLYRAKNKTARAVFKRCFSDVAADSWYEEVVCDAEHENYVQGYSGGGFGPEKSVNRVEGLKMVLNVLGFTVPGLTQEDRLSLDFLSVSHSAWYAPFLHRSLALSLVPEEMTKENEFIPDLPLRRGEVAEIIYRALNTEDVLDESMGYEDYEDKEDKTQTEEVDKTEPSKQNSNESPRGESTYVEVTPKAPEDVTFPFNRNDKTGSRGSAAYTFSLAAADTLHLEVTNHTSSSISCFLYLLDESGIPDEIFFGFQEGNSCFIRAGVREGNYQYEVRTQDEGDKYSVHTRRELGDGNDGPREAITLSMAAPRTSRLTENDYTDWFRFTISSVSTHRVKITAAGDLVCTIHPGKDVDLFGFNEPECGLTSEFQPGTYYVTVQRLRPPAAAEYPYTIDLR